VGKPYSAYLKGELIGPTISMNMSISSNTTYSQICPDCDHEKCSLERGRSEEKSQNSNQRNPNISYEINNYGYRSDDILKENSEHNFLYNGCSNTFGIGIPKKSIWSYQLNTLLGGERFINLGINSGSYKTIVYDVFNYIRNFGKPKGVFLLFPNIERHVTFMGNKDRDTSIFVNVYRNTPQQERISSIITQKSNMFEFYNTVKMLEDYLFELNIPLIWTTWDSDLHKSISSNNNFKNYVSLDNFNIFNKIQSAPRPSELDNDYWHVARDGSHLGSKYHLYYALIMHEEWKKKYEKNN
jgi:hypothetical protein